MLIISVILVVSFNKYLALPFTKITVNSNPSPHQFYDSMGESSVVIDYTIIFKWTLCTIYIYYKASFHLAQSGQNQSKCFLT